MSRARARALAALVAVALVAGIPGCTGGREISRLPIVLGMAADMGVTPGELVITVQLAKARGGAGGSGGSGAAGAGIGPTGEEARSYWNAQGAGRTVFDACREITKVVSERLFTAHCQVLIFSRDVAESGIECCIDALMRDEEVRPTALVLIADGEGADVLDVRQEFADHPALAQAGLVRSSKWTAEAPMVTRRQFAAMMLSSTTSPIAPVVSIKPGFGGRPTIVAAGTAVFRGTRMVGVLDSAQSRGLLWGLDQVTSMALVVPAADGLATVEVMNARAVVRPGLSEGRPTISVDINCDLSLTEQTAKANLATLAQFSALEGAVVGSIKSDVIAAYERSKALAADVFGFGELFRERLPDYWRQVEGEWQSIYPTVNLEIRVTAKMRDTGGVFRSVLSGTP